MTRRGFLTATGVAALSAQTSTPPPNIVFILADDLGYGDLGCYGQKKILTPEIDRLATEGVRFTHVYAGASVCAPSRCCLMTGKHTGHGTVRQNRGLSGRIPLRPDDMTVAEVLKTAGYRTGIFGKWGLGEAGTLGVPNYQGFDEWFGFLNQDHALEYYPTHLWENDHEFFPGGNQGAKQKDYVQDLFTARALGFIDANKSRPFFLYLAYTTPHASSERGRDTGDGFVVPSYEPYSDRDWPRPEKGFASMVTMLDRDVGKILAQLRKAGIDNNTLVIFASDNGTTTDSGHTPQFFGSAGPFRGQKGTLYEGGIRVPAIARWPGKLTPGMVSEEVWAFWDFLPTCAELAGVPAPRDIDGTSFASLLRGETKAGPRHDYLYWEDPGRTFVQAIRMGDWKGIRHGLDRPLELYNLPQDPGESKDLAQQHPDIRKQIEERMKTARVESDEYPTVRTRKETSGAAAH